jgi:hypothetical protein
MRDRGVRERRFERLYDAHYQAIAGYVLRRVAAHEADDVIAQVFTVAWRRFDQVPAPPGDAEPPRQRELFAAGALLAITWDPLSPGTTFHPGHVRKRLSGSFPQ